MKITLVLFVVAVLVCDLALGRQIANTESTYQNCQCMRGKFCDGEINSDVQCHPSYLMVCCIRPKPEPIPPYIPEESKNKVKNDMQNENVKEQDKIVKPEENKHKNEAIANSVN